MEGITDVEMDWPEPATKKRVLMETPDSSDDAPAEKYWRGDDFVAKTWMDKLQEWGYRRGCCNGHMDGRLPGWRWRTGQTGRDRSHGESAGLLAHGVKEDVKRVGQLQIPDDTLGEGLAHGTWRVEHEGPIDLLHDSTSGPSTERICSLLVQGRVIDFIALKLGLKTF